VRFLDEDLNSVSVNLYDPEVWRKYGWRPVNDPEFRRRFVGLKNHDDLNAENPKLRDLDAYFSAVLRRAERFHQALDAGSSTTPPVMLLAMGGDCEETLAA